MSTFNTILHWCSCFLYPKLYPKHRAGADNAVNSLVFIALMMFHPTQDNLCTKGMPTTAGSRALEGYIPSYDATAVKRLRDAGAIVLGKTNMDEFGMGSSTENSAMAGTANPWDLSRVPGGSSGGSAAAVASGLAPVALGSDTGGSIRQPSHFCGVVGLKPTYGRVSRNGLIAYGSSLDTVGPMGSSVQDVAMVLEATTGYDPADSTSSKTEQVSILASLVAKESLSCDPMKGVRVGIVKETLGDGVDAAVESTILDAAKHLESLGAIVEGVNLPSFSFGLPAYYVLALSEASSNLSRYDGIRYGRPSLEADNLRELYMESRKRLGAEVKRRILMGTYALSAGYYDAYYKRAQQVRTIVSQEMDSALHKYDLLLSPVAPTAAYRFGEKSSNPLEMYKGDLMTVNVNLAGLPAISIPFQVIDGLPIGVQLIGGRFREQKLLELAHIFEITAEDGPIRPPKYFV